MNIEEAKKQIEVLNNEVKEHMDNVTIETSKAGRGDVSDYEGIIKKLIEIVNLEDKIKRFKMIDLNTKSGKILSDEQIKKIKEYENTKDNYEMVISQLTLDLLESIKDIDVLMERLNNDSNEDIQYDYKNCQIKILAKMETLSKMFITTYEFIKHINEFYNNIQQ